MKAIVATKYGAPDVLQLQEVVKPTPKDNEILVKVHASSATTADGMMRTGKPYFGRLLTGLTKPKNPIIFCHTECPNLQQRTNVHAFASMHARPNASCRQGQRAGKPSLHSNTANRGRSTLL